MFGTVLFAYKPLAVITYKDIDRPDVPYWQEKCRSEDDWCEEPKDNKNIRRCVNAD